MSTRASEQPEPIVLTRLERGHWRSVNLRSEEYFVWTPDEIRLSPNADPQNRTTARCLNFKLCGESKLFLRLSNIDIRGAPANFVVRLLRVENPIPKEIVRTSARLNGGEVRDLSFDFEASEGRFDFEIVVYLDAGAATSWAWATVKWPTIHHPSSVLRLRHPPLVDSNRVVVGKRGWLFLNGDTNESLAQITGERRLSADEMDGWRVELRRRLNCFSDRGVKHVMLISPNKESIVPQNLPDYVRRTHLRVVDRFFECVPDGMRYVYPAEALALAHAEMSTYGETETHWTDYGAFLATNLVLEAFGEPERLGPISQEEAEFRAIRTAGDLGARLEPVVVGEFVQGSMKNESSKRIFDNHLGNTGRAIIYKSSRPIGLSLMIFGDSFAHPMFKWLKEKFERLVFVHASAIDTELIELIRPDFVLVEIVERFLVGLPKPLNDYSFEDVIFAKFCSFPRQVLLECIRNIEGQLCDDPVARLFLDRHLELGRAALRGMAPPQ